MIPKNKDLCAEIDRELSELDDKQRTELEILLDKYIRSAWDVCERIDTLCLRMDETYALLQSRKQP